MKAPIRNIQGLSRAWFLLRLKLAMFFHFLPCLFAASGPGPSSLRRPRLSPRRFVLVLRRLLLFLSRLGHNKFVRIGSVTRLDLYVPGFPGPAFNLACRKFLTFDGPLPCATVLLSVTSACRFSCPHCYQRLDRGKDMPLEVLVSVARRLQERGIAFFNIEGGEPFLVYERLRQVCAAIDARSEVWVNSTGDGLTLERLRELRDLNLTAVMFSLHASEPARLNAFMKSDRAWEMLQRGVEVCHAAGVPVAFNTCLGREGFYDGEFERIMERAKEFGACLVQLIKPKPAGAWLRDAPVPFNPQDQARAVELVQRYNHHRAFAAYPSISAQTLEEDRACFGCTAGGTDRFYINAKGDVPALRVSQPLIRQHCRRGFRRYLCPDAARLLAPGPNLALRGQHASHPPGLRGQRPAQPAPEPAVERANLPRLGPRAAHGPVCGDGEAAVKRKPRNTLSYPCRSLCRSLCRAQPDLDKGPDKGPERTQGPG